MFLTTYILEISSNSIALHIFCHYITMHHICNAYNTTAFYRQTQVFMCILDSWIRMFISFFENYDIQFFQIGLAKISLGIEGSYKFAIPIWLLFLSIKIKRRNQIANSSKICCIETYISYFRARMSMNIAFLFNYIYTILQNDNDKDKFSTFYCFYNMLNKTALLSYINDFYVSVFL